MFVVPVRCAKHQYPHDLPTISVVLIYLDEALSIIKRAVRSIIDKTPQRLLKDIILVDDHSSNGLPNWSMLSAYKHFKVYLLTFRLKVGVAFNFRWVPLICKCLLSQRI